MSRAQVFNFSLWKSGLLLLLILGDLSTSLLLVYGLTSASSPQTTPYAYAKIDFSAVNEYIHEHYGNFAGSDPYFPPNSSDAPVFDARQGILQKPTKSKNCREYILTEPSLESCGFELIQAPSLIKSWNDRQQLTNVYLQELRRILEQKFGKQNILHKEFFHPMLRGEDLSMTSTQASTQSKKNNLLPKSPTAAMAHIDNDIGAFEQDQVVSIVENSCLFEPHQKAFPRSDLLNAIKQGHRFLVINCWRNIGATPIRRAPLGIYAVQYSKPSDCFPASTPDFPKSRWYVFPEMTTKECVLFKQYDRDKRFVSDLWHCALHSLTIKDVDAPPRRSLDLRVFLVLKEKVSMEYDRYSEDRIRPLLTYEESKDFCRTQGAAREQQ